MGNLTNDLQTDWSYESIGSNLINSDEIYENSDIVPHFNVTVFINTTTTLSASSTSTVTNSSVSESVFESKIIIPLYVIIFLLAVIGNSLVLVTLVQNKRMRTVTNVYLLNLAVSDLLLGVFCMPFTLVGQVLRNFIFGAAMCKLIPYFQVVSVSVGVWTLVAISLERYFAICRPLKSRRWQTQFHAYKMITIVWLGSLLWSAPVLIVSSLKAMKGRAHKCREEWPSNSSEQAYNLFLDAMLLLVPLVIMSLAYSLIMSKLWKGLKREIQHNTSCQRQMLERSTTPTYTDDFWRNANSENLSTDVLTPLRQHRLMPPVKRNFGEARICANDKHGRKTEAVKMWLQKGMVQVRLPSTKNRTYRDYSKAKTSLVSKCDFRSPLNQQTSNGHCNDECTGNETTYTFSRHAIRSNYMDKSIEAKKKVIRMLFVVVAEFFICWAPLHILNTYYLFYPEIVYRYVGSTGISLVQLLAYISSCCNPITYCFMNRKFRQAFIGVFNCYSVCCCMDQEVAAQGLRIHLTGAHRVVQNNSDISGNDSTVYVGRASTLGRSEVVVLEAEDRV